MKITEGLVTLELQMDLRGTKAAIYPTLIWDGNITILVDTGLPGQFQAICDEFEKIGKTIEDLDLIILTHHDIDHIGNLSTVKNKLGSKVTVLSHQSEKPYIEFEKRSPKITPEREAQIKDLVPMLKSKVDITVLDDDFLPYCGGIRVIHTPGHTPGHICLYLDQYQVLITGDALNIVDAKLVGPSPQYTPDMGQAQDSLKKLLAFNIQTIISYHGGVYSGDANQALLNLLSDRS